MATQKEVLEKLGTEEELLYWAAKGGIALEQFSGGWHVNEWSIYTNNKTITSVERRMDEPREL